MYTKANPLSKNSLLFKYKVALLVSQLGTPRFVHFFLAQHG